MSLTAKPVPAFGRHALVKKRSARALALGDRVTKPAKRAVREGGETVSTGFVTEVAGWRLEGRP